MRANSSPSSSVGGSRRVLFRRRRVALSAALTLLLPALAGTTPAFSLALDEVPRYEPGIVSSYFYDDADDYFAEDLDYLPGDYDDADDSIEVEADDDDLAGDPKEDAEFTKPENSGNSAPSADLNHDDGHAPYLTDSLTSNGYDPEPQEIPEYLQASPAIEPVEENLGILAATDWGADINLGETFSDGDFGTGWTYSVRTTSPYIGIFTLNDDFNGTIYGTSSTCRTIEIQAGGPVMVTLAEATLSCTSLNDSPIILRSGAVATVKLIGTNTLEGDNGINVPSGAYLTITGTGKLLADAYSSVFGAGIGGSWHNPPGSITIAGNVTVEARSSLGAGVGGGYDGSGGSVVISEWAKVTAISSQGAGIGGGSGGSGGSIVISDNAAVTATSSNGAGIGGGNGGSGGSIVISDNVEVTATSWQGAGVGGGYQGAGGSVLIYGTPKISVDAGYSGGRTFGSGRGSDDQGNIFIAVPEGNLTLRGAGPVLLPMKLNAVPAFPGPQAISATLSAPFNSTVDIMTITDQGVLDVHSNVGVTFSAPGASGHRASPSSFTNLTAPQTIYFLTNNVINIGDTSRASGDGWTLYGTEFRLTSGANVTVTGTSGPACNSIVVEVEEAWLTLDNAVIDCSADSQSPLSLRPGSQLYLSLVGANNLQGGTSKAGVAVPQGAILEISGPGSLSSLGGSDGAGIGGSESIAAGSVVVLGGTVNAKGGAHGAGVGGGGSGAGGTVRVTGGELSATGGFLAAGIGGGDRGPGGSLLVSGGTVIASNTLGGLGVGGGDGWIGTGSLQAFGPTTVLNLSGSAPIAPIASPLVTPVPFPSALPDEVFIVLPAGNLTIDGAVVSTNLQLEVSPAVSGAVVQATAGSFNDVPVWESPAGVTDFAAFTNLLDVTFALALPSSYTGLGYQVVPAGANVVTNQFVAPVSILWEAISPPPPPSSDTSLFGIEGLLGLVFDGSNGAVSVLYSQRSVTLLPQVATGATGLVCLDSACTAVVSGPVGLAVGANVFYVRVTAADGTLALYTITISRATPTLFPILDHFPIHDGNNLIVGRVGEEHGNFIGTLTLNDAIVDPSLYLTWHGSTYVRLSQALLDSLADGEHSVVLHFREGYSEVMPLRIARASLATSPTVQLLGHPATGVSLLPLAMAFGLIGFGSLVRLRVKPRNPSH